MIFKLYSVLNIFVLIAMTQAAFKDFIIENEKDLERFSLPNTDIYDDDLEYDSLNAWPYGADNDAGGNCDAMDTYDSYDNYDAEYKVNMEGYEGLRNGQIDANVLREVIRQIKNDPRFKHLRDHLSEENIYFDQNGQKKLSQYYVDVNEENNVYDEYE